MLNICYQEKEKQMLSVIFFIYASKILNLGETSYNVCSDSCLMQALMIFTLSTHLEPTNLEDSIRLRRNCEPHQAAAIYFIYFQDMK